MLRAYRASRRDWIGYTPRVDGERLTFTEFVDLSLARVAEADAEEPGDYFDLFTLKHELRMPVDDEWIYNAADLLDTRGLARWMKVPGAMASVKLTGAGRRYVEAGGDSDIIGEYQREPSAFVRNVSGHGHNVASSESVHLSQTARDEDNEVLLLVSRIEAGLDGDASLSPEEKAAFETDLEAVRGQLHKLEPNRRAMAALLEPMAGLASVGSFVVQLLSMLG
jgi:hypothetical protein